MVGAGSAGPFRVCAKRARSSRTVRAHTKRGYSWLLVLLRVGFATGHSLRPLGNSVHRFQRRTRPVARTRAPQFLPLSLTPLAVQPLSPGQKPKPPQRALNLPSTSQLRFCSSAKLMGMTTTSQSLRSGWSPSLPWLLQRWPFNAQYKGTWHDRRNIHRNTRRVDILGRAQGLVT